MRKLLISGAVVLAMASVSVRADDKEQTLKLSDAPQAVQDAIHKALNGKEVTGFSKENEDGKTEYEAEYKDSDGMNATVSVAEDGKVLEEEHEVPTASLPEAVSKAISDKYPDAKIAKAELSKANGKSVYELHLSNNDKEQEVKVSADGAIQKAEKDEKGEGKEKDND